eukprot:403336584
MDHQHFNKNFVQNMLKNLKKQNSQNKNIIQEILIQILTSPCHSSTRSDIHQYMIFDMASSRSSFDRAQFIYFCQNLSTKISKRYFQEIFIDSYLSLLDDKQVAVQVALVKSIKEIRFKIDDVLQINKIENYLNSIKSDPTRKEFIREIADQQFEILMSSDYRTNLQSSENRRSELNLAASEMSIYQQEREQSEIEKKKDIEKIVKQAKDVYFNKINQSFTFSKQSGMTNNQSARQGSATLSQQNDFMHKRKSNNLQQIKTAYQVGDSQKQLSTLQTLTTSSNTLRKRSTGPNASGIQSSNQSRMSLINQREETKRDVSADNLIYSNSVVTNNNSNNFSFSTLLPPINRGNYEFNSQSNSGLNSGETSSKHMSTHGNIVSSRNITKAATQGQSNNSIGSGVPINSNINTNYGFDYNSQGFGLQNPKNMIPIHPASIKNRPGRKIEVIQTQKVMNYKNLAVSPLLNPRKQFEMKKQ